MGVTLSQGLVHNVMPIGYNILKNKLILCLDP